MGLLSASIDGLAALSGPEARWRDLSRRGSNRGRRIAEHRGRVAAEIGDEDASSVRGKRLRVPERLRTEQEPETHRPAVVAGNLEVVGRLIDEFDEEVSPRVSLVKLAGRVEEARAVAERGGAVRRIAKGPP